MSLAQMYQKRIPKAYRVVIETAMGGMWIGVPTMVQVIMASGLQNPRSVSVPRLALSNCVFKVMSRLFTTVIVYMLTSSELEVTIANHVTKFRFSTPSKMYSWGCLLFQVNQVDMLCLSIYVHVCMMIK